MLPPQPAGAAGAGTPPEHVLSTAALNTDGLDDSPVPRRRVFAWALWDWATQPFNSVILTFVFVSLYLVSDAFLPAGVAEQNADGDMVCSRAADAATEYCGGLSDLAEWYGWVDLRRRHPDPAAGARARPACRRRRQQEALGGRARPPCSPSSSSRSSSSTPSPQFFWLGAVLVALGSVASEIAGVNYNAMLVQVSTPQTIGRVSGLGWGLGYIGGILALVHRRRAQHRSTGSGSTCRTAWPTASSPSAPRCGRCCSRLPFVFTCPRRPRARTA